MNPNIIINKHKELIPSSKEIGIKPVQLFTKSITCKNLPKDRVFNSVLGTTHEIIPDPLGIDGVCHFFQSLSTTCPLCGVTKKGREIWGTQEYAIMHCKECKIYTWKHYHTDIEQAHKNTDFKKMKYMNRLSLKWER